MGLLDLLVLAVLAAACLALLLVSRYATDLEKRAQEAERKLLLLG